MRVEHCHGQIVQQRENYLHEKIDALPEVSVESGRKELASTIT